MTALSDARAALDAAEAAYAGTYSDLLRAQQDEGRAAVALSDAGTVYGDEPSEVRADSYLAARDARELAALRCAGVQRRHDGAEAGLKAARSAELRARFDVVLAAASRSRVFDELADVVRDLAAIDAVPPVLVDIDGVPDDLLAKRLGEQAERQALRTMRSRTVRQALAAQATAVADARTAAVELGQRVPDEIAEVRESEVEAMVRLEVSGLVGETWTPETCADWIGSWSPLHPYSPGTQSPASSLVHMLAGQHWATPADWFAFARAALLSGDPAKVAYERVGARAAQAAPLSMPIAPAVAELLQFARTDRGAPMPHKVTIS